MELSDNTWSFQVQGIFHLFHDEVKTFQNQTSHPLTRVFSFLGREVVLPVFPPCQLPIIGLTPISLLSTLNIGAVDIDPEPLYTPISHWDYDRVFPEVGKGGDGLSV